MARQPRDAPAQGKLGEVWDELRTVLSGRGHLLDSVLPAVLFVIVNAVVGFQYAAWSSLGLAAAFAILRLARRQPVRYALGGLGAVVVAASLALLLGRAEGFYLPGAATSLLTAVACGISVLVRRPLAAWTSYFVRRWPLEWYWHPSVLPAYSEVTLAWTVFYGLRTWLQFTLLSGDTSAALGVVNVAAGWPALIVLLVASYLYGTWRLRTLGGPSTEEFEAGVEPPWESQRRGF